MKSLFYCICLLSIALLYDNPLHAQYFEGEIMFVREDHIDTVYLLYKIKGDKVRLEELDHQMNLENLTIADLSKKQVFALNPKRKLYVELPVHPWNGNIDTANFKVMKTGNYKTIKGFKCFQWRVQSKKDDTEITYWMTNEDFPFYLTFQKLINKSERISQYYLNIADVSGLLPFESVERSMLREWRMRSEVVRFEKKPIQTSLFEIPQGYKMFQKN